MVIDSSIVCGLLPVWREEQQLRLQHHARLPAAPCRDQHEVRVCARVVPHEADAFRLQPVRTERAEQIGQPLRLVDKEELAAEAQRIRRARAEIVYGAADLAAGDGSCTVR